MFVSSAKRKKDNLLDMFGKSFMYNKKSRGPRTEPCGTPQEIDNVSEETPLKYTNCLRSVNPLIHGVHYSGHHIIPHNSLKQ